MSISSATQMPRLLRSNTHSLVFGVVALVLLAYFLVYWVTGMGFTPKNARP
jgi:hypothetical protein